MAPALISLDDPGLHRILYIHVVRLLTLNRAVVRTLVTQQPPAQVQVVSLSPEQHGFEQPVSCAHVCLRRTTRTVPAQLMLVIM
jgi:hypothetical protein